MPQETERNNGKPNATKKMPKNAKKRKKMGSGKRGKKKRILGQYIFRWFLEYRRKSWKSHDFSGYGIYDVVRLVYIFTKSNTRLRGRELVPSFFTRSYIDLDSGGVIYFGDGTGRMFTLVGSPERTDFYNSIHDTFAMDLAIGFKLDGIID